MELSAAQHALVRERDEASALRAAAKESQTHQVEQEGLVQHLEHLLAVAEAELAQQQQRQVVQAEVRTHLLLDLAALQAEAAEASSLLQLQRRVQEINEREAEEARRAGAAREVALQAELMRLDTALNAGACEMASHLASLLFVLQGEAGADSGGDGEVTGIYSEMS